ncbi:solute carrier-like protein [Dinothrombium tinctorium]|uniref:Solute carrier-like protein n=1 Tax=Dinothrombium tinctorium TaxID=1965070 RepID=A0A3S3R3T8_9ACAR|nr:solute carrier-like protein [Dinothrombium tinctorium]
MEGGREFGPRTGVGGDEFSIWTLGPRPDLIAKGPRRRVDFGAASDVQSEEKKALIADSAAICKPQSVESDPDYSKLKSSVFGIINLLSENVILHPFIVIRRQCQVNESASRYHLTPFTVLPVIGQLEARQGFNSLWKGVGSVLITRGLQLSIESIIAEVTTLDKEVNRLDVKTIFKHLLLKGISVAIITPFFASSCVETVQSSVASEVPGVLDCLKEGVIRFTYWRREYSTRLLPFWVLCGPTVVYHLLHYIVSSFAKSFILWRRRKFVKKGVATSEVNSIEYQEITATVFANLTADALLYPLETILHRLYLQGTRTLIDNIDSIVRVKPVISNYDGPVDCYRSIVSNEGTTGLFKGFGALVLQYAIHFAFLKVTHIVFQEFLPSIKRN